jgi:hypothetical protein
MVDLVTLEEVKDRLSITFDSQDERIDGLIAEATGIILDYIGNPEQDWTAETVPQPVRTSIMLAISRLYANDAEQVITDAIRRILRRTRRPVVA